MTAASAASSVRYVVLAEVLVARRIEQVERVAGVRELQHRRRDRNARSRSSSIQSLVRLALAPARRDLARDVNRSAV